LLPTTEGKHGWTRRERRWPLGPDLVLDLLQIRMRGKHEEVRRGKESGGWPKGGGGLTRWCRNRAEMVAGLRTFGVRFCSGQSTSRGQAKGIEGRGAGLFKEGLACRGG
jgi:hypothetical protein